jgi:hypothetical protein
MSADSYNALEHAITEHVFDELEQEIPWLRTGL